MTDFVFRFTNLCIMAKCDNMKQNCIAKQWIKSQILWGHDLDLLGSGDHWTRNIWFPISDPLNHPSVSHSC